MSLQPYEEAQPARFTGELAAWAQDATAAHQVATSLVRTSFVPDAFRNKPDEATAAILAGAEVGLRPMGALRSFHIIKGIASPTAMTQRAIVQNAGHEVWVEESSDTRAVVAGRRRGSDKEQRSVWTIERARQQELPRKNPNWGTQPQAMLLARATSELCRLIAADAILGMPYAVEELGDDTDAGDAPPVKRTAQRARRALTPAAPETAAAGPVSPSPDPAAAPLPPLPGEEDQPEPPTEEPADGITPAQLKKLHATFNDLGITDREDRLAHASEIAGRPLTTSTDLTKAEATRLIDELVQIAEARQLELADDE